MPYSKISFHHNSKFMYSKRDAAKYWMHLSLIFIG